MAWSRIRGHDDARRQLFSAYQRGRLAHAYLFVGPDGVGKKAFALELAKALLCERPPAELTACDRCPACAQVMAGTHPDVTTARKPDDKQEFVIDVMRDLCNQLGLKPARGMRKVAIIEDADDFNEESANCFLKTLEEPPPGAVLILLATATERQLPTILSRCQLVRFKALSPADLRAALADHDITDPTTVDKLTRIAGGSVGRAVALNDPALWEFRQVLVSALGSNRPDAVGLASKFDKFVEEAGKESAAKRDRASLVIRLLTDILQTALRLSLGAEGATTDPAEAEKLRALSSRDPDLIADMLEACTDADRHVERRVQLVLVIEQLADRLARVG